MWWRGRTTGDGDVSVETVAEGGVVEVETDGEGTDYATLFGGESGGELQCHSLIFGIVAEELHSRVESESLGVVHVQI